MIFEVSADQIERLDESQIISLLRRLILAELRKNSIPLRSGTTPAQINIPDGGDDGRVEWTGGPNETDWLPSRFTIFQCKKGSTSPSGLKLETQTKSSQGTQNPQVNEAIEEVLARSGSYVVVTGKPVVGTNIDRRIDAIKAGIVETGNDSSLLSSIKIYDCNRLSTWTNTHPSVALWVNELLREIHLGGFQTCATWGRTPEISEIEFQQSDDTRFVAKGSVVQTWKNDDPSIVEAKSFDQIREVISTFLLLRGNAVRVIGPSGYGKTRLVHQLVASQDGLPDDVLYESQIIFCVYEDVKDQLLNIAREIVDTGSQTLLIVDDCPDAVYTRLIETVHRDGSRCLLITIGVETKAHGINRNLIVELNAASNELIGHIAEATNKEVSKKNSSHIRELSNGFPRMAVFASRALEGGDEELSSVETLISRIVWGEHQEDRSAFESLQILNLFTIVGIENDAANELDEIAAYTGKTAQNLFRELSRFTERGVLFRQGDYGEVQPLPLAMRLSNQWLEANPAGSLESLFRSLSEEMKLRMVGRLRWVSWSDKVTNFACTLLAEAVPDENSLDSEFGSKLLDRFVHLAPDATMQHLDRLLSGKSIDELKAFDSGRRYVIWALEKLVFRRQTFDAAARLLLKLGAAENEDWANNASGQFTGLYQVYLSGTEASPSEKILVLDDGLACEDERIRKLCIEALNRMLDTGHFSRSGGSEHIGTGEAMQDWTPTIYEEIFDYHRAALLRLESVSSDSNDPHQQMALDNIGSHLRSLFSIEPMLEELQSMIARLRETHPRWNMAAHGVNEWLYFDRNDASDDHKNRLREYYNELLPAEPLEQIYFYSSGSTIDIHDPDVCYERDGDNDHDYGTNKIKELVDASATEAAYFFSLIETFLLEPTNSGWITVQHIAKHVDDPENIVQYLLEAVAKDSKINVISNLLRNVISGASQTDRNIGLACLEIALSNSAFEASSIDFFAAAGFDDALIHRTIELIKTDAVAPHQVSVIAYSDILHGLNHNLIESLVRTLLSKQEQGAWAAVDFLARALYRSEPTEGLLHGVLAETVINPLLFEKAQFTNMDWYHWCELVKKLLDGGHVDNQFHGDLVSFIISVTSVEEYNVQLAFDDYAQKILRRLISITPCLVWKKFHEARESADGRSGYRLPSLFGAGVGEPSAPGVLNDIPPDIYIPWMLENKNERMVFILGWMQLFVVANNVRIWAPDFVSFVDDYVDCPDSLDELRMRLTAGIWSGSYANKLENEREQLLQLREVSENQQVHSWVDRVTTMLDQQIVVERIRDANREASYRT